MDTSPPGIYGLKWGLLTGGLGTDLGQPGNSYNFMVKHLYVHFGWETVHSLPQILKHSPPFMGPKVEDLGLKNNTVEIWQVMDK